MPGGKYCPDRWRMEHWSAGLFTPNRPPVCGCFWSRSLIAEHFKAIMKRLPEIGRLEQLFP